MEQTLTADAEQISEQLNAVPEPVAEAPVEAVAEFDLSTPEKAKAFAAQHPAFEAVFAAERNTERQRALSEMRRERGSDESIRSYHADLVKEVDRRLREGIPLDDLGKDTPLFAKANREAVEITLYQGLYEQAKAVDPDAVAALEGFVQEGLSAEQWKGLAQASMNALTNTSKKAALSEWLDSDEIDESTATSKKYKAIEAKFKRELEAELNAREIEGKPKPAVAPITPNGNVAEQMSRQRLEAMSPNQRMEYLLGLSDEDRSAMWDVAVTPA